MTIDSKYLDEAKRARHTGTRYRFRFESVGDSALNVWLEATYNDGGMYRYPVDPADYEAEFGRLPLIYQGGQLEFDEVVADPDLPEGRALYISQESLDIVMERKTPITQTTAFGFEESFPAESFEFGLDKLTMIFQEIEGNKCACQGQDVDNPDTPEEKPLPPTEADLPCKPYACDAIEVWAQSNTEAWWPMNDPQTKSAPGAQFLRTGGTEPDWEFNSERTD